MKNVFTFAPPGARSRWLRIGASIGAIAVVIGLVLSLTSAAFAKGDPSTNLISRVRAATARYHDLSTARAAGYAAFLGCIDQPGQGAMGYHFVNGSLVSTVVLDPQRPQALLYESQDGRMQLTGVEYVVFAAPWKNAGHTQPPALFGKTFNFTDFPNRYGLPPFYSLHAWVWKSNPSGMFANWNPNVSCEDDQ